MNQQAGALAASRLRPMLERRCTTRDGTGLFYRCWPAAAAAARAQFCCSTAGTSTPAAWPISSRSSTFPSSPSTPGTSAGTAVPSAGAAPHRALQPFCAMSMTSCAMSRRRTASQQRRWPSSPRAWARCSPPPGRTTTRPGFAPWCWPRRLLRCASTSRSPCQGSGCSAGCAATSSSTATSRPDSSRRTLSASPRSSRWAYHTADRGRHAARPQRDGTAHRPGCARHHRPHPASDCGLRCGREARPAARVLREPRRRHQGAPHPAGVLPRPPRREGARTCCARCPQVLDRALRTADRAPVAPRCPLHRLYPRRGRPAGHPAADRDPARRLLGGNARRTEVRRPAVAWASPWASAPASTPGRCSTTSTATARAGCGRIGPILDRTYLDAPGWRGIRQRKLNVEALIAEAMRRLDGEGRPVDIVDIAAGHGRYVAGGARPRPDPRRTACSCATTATSTWKRARG